MRTFAAAAIASCFRISNPLMRKVRITQLIERVKMIDEQTKRTPGKLRRNEKISTLESAR
jgi:hypothetical protein